MGEMAGVVRWGPVVTARRVVALIVSLVVAPLAPTIYLRFVWYAGGLKWWGISKPGPGEWWFTYPGTRYVLPVARVLSKAGAVSRVGGDFASERAIR